MSTETIKDTLAPRETNGHVVFLKKLHWFKKESQVEAYVDEIIRPRQVEYCWPEQDDRAKKAKQQNMDYVCIVCENKYAAETLVKEINLEGRKGEFYGRTRSSPYELQTAPASSEQTSHEQTAPHASKQHAFSFNSSSYCVGLSSHVRRPGM
ncbi:hypothetical protein CGLO_05126 [Colletotrichum gloeosporioides Cg-14]|uniref:Uncharacterized protein n=1 Tax=Colletotrichum gloeosporioides (strain Cg-14) TaxID=1237896 RepID=T0LTB8_COLGC|nr:hypothetical protein CGLO_05126 [Colletotrichum gloeosporioides Cg-14]